MESKNQMGQTAQLGERERQRPGALRQGLILHRAWTQPAQSFHVGRLVLRSAGMLIRYPDRELSGVVTFRLFGKAPRQCGAERGV